MADGVKEEVGRAVAAVIPAMPAHSKHTNQLAGQEIIETRGMVDTVIWLKACSWSSRAIARHLGISAKTVDRFCRRPDFADMVERTALEVGARVNDAARLRTLNVLSEALETKIVLMRDKKANPYLRDKIATDLWNWGQEFLKASGGGGDKNALKAMMEMVQRVRGKDGKVTEMRARVTGSPEAVQAAAATLPGTGDDSVRGSEGAGPDGSAGPDSGS